MTIVDRGEPRFGNVTCDATQQQQQNFSFNIVLVDIKHAAQEKEIRCAEKPLFPEKDLKYVALSYRWGQFQETIIDTGLGYLAGMTAFDVEDLYQLCSLMMQEPDLQHMDYVWVDAICVDHNNMEQRKATIHQMSNIYGHANYILAVPDFHKGYLQEVYYQKKWDDTLNDRKTIYHLLHGNVDALVQMENNLLRRHAENDTLRQTPADPVQLLSDRNVSQWKPVIDEKFDSLHACMKCLIHSATDWASRVLVISECHMAKRKNKFKFWFAMLGNDDLHPISFFNYDLHRSSSPELAFHTSHIASLDSTTCHRYTSMYNEFHSTMAHQLKRKQSFLEMMLKSKTSKNDDRFYAILPISEYKDKLTSKYTVGTWNINTMMSVKLKLYEIMNTKDKWLLFFMSGNPGSISKNMVFPTFAATTLHFPADSPCLLLQEDEASICNVDTTCDVAMTLVATTKKEGECQYKLHIKPKEYYALNAEDPLICQSAWRKPALCERLQLHETDGSLAVLCIPYVNPAAMEAKGDDTSYWSRRQIYLVGSFEKNKWALTKMPQDNNVALEPHWTLHTSHGGFDIY